MDIYVMNADGGDQRNLTKSNTLYDNPSWSPDGERIVFASIRGGNMDIYVMDADGGNPQNLTNHPEDDTTPAWYNSVLSVAPAGKTLTTWGWVKQVDR